MLDAIETIVPLFGNKHRCSNQTKPKTDVFMVEALMQLYPDFDGYICTNFWPSYHHGGFLLPETCLFRPRNIVQLDTSYSSRAGASKKRAQRKKKNQMINGYRKNEFGGVDFNLEDFCKENGINYDDMIVVNHLIYEDL